MVKNSDRETRSKSKGDSLSEDNKVLFDLLTEKFEEMMSLLAERDEKINKLEVKVASMESIISDLRVRVDDVEAENRSSSIIVSGERLPLYSPNENSIQVACEVLKSDLKYEISRSSIIAGFRLGKKVGSQADGRKSILLRLCNRETKHDILTACRTVKPRDLFVNESLIPRRAHILYLLRKAKKQHSVISGCGSSDGRVFVYLKSTTSNIKGNRMIINSIEELDQWVQRFLGGKLSDQDCNGL